MSAAFLAVAGGLMGAYGSMASARAQEKAAAYNAMIARQNAKIARDQAKKEAAIIKSQGLKSLGSFTAGVGKSGLTMEGSLRDVLIESARNVKRDELETIYQGELRARGYMIEASQETFSGKVAKKLGYFNAASQMLGGGAQAYRYSSLSNNNNNPPPKNKG